MDQILSGMCTVVIHTCIYKDYWWELETTQQQYLAVSKFGGNPTCDLYYRFFSCNYITYWVSGTQSITLLQPLGTQSALSYTDIRSRFVFNDYLMTSVSALLYSRRHPVFCRCDAIVFLLCQRPTRAQQQQYLGIALECLTEKGGKVAQFAL